MSKRVLAIPHWLACKLPRRLRYWVVADAIARASFNHPATALPDLEPAQILEATRDQTD